jgi:hypothetical protein
MCKITMSSSFRRNGQGKPGGGGGPGGRRRRCSGVLRARVAGAGGRGDRGDFGVLLTLEWENGRVAGGGPQWRPAAAPRGGDGPMHLRRRGVAERVCLGEGMLLVASICSAGAPMPANQGRPVASLRAAVARLPAGREAGGGGVCVRA